MFNFSPQVYSYCDSHLKTILVRYFQTGKVSKNNVKKLFKDGISKETIMEIDLKDDPTTFKDESEPFNPVNIDEIEFNYEPILPPDYGVFDMDR